MKPCKDICQDETCERPRKHMCEVCEILWPFAHFKGKWWAMLGHYLGIHRYKLNRHFKQQTGGKSNA